MQGLTLQLRELVEKTAQIEAREQALSESMTAKVKELITRRLADHKQSSSLAETLSAERDAAKSQLVRVEQDLLNMQTCLTSEQQKLSTAGHGQRCVPSSSPHHYHCRGSTAHGVHGLLVNVLSALYTSTSKLKSHGTGLGNHLSGSSCVVAPQVPGVTNLHSGVFWIVADTYIMHCIAVYHTATNFQLAPSTAYSSHGRVFGC